MIEFKNVIFNYDQHLVFKNFNVKFVSQKINCIIGPSAVGKSTLLNLVAKIINPLKGQIINPDHNISYLFQEERLIDEITVYKNLDLILKSVYLDINKRRQLIEVGLKSVELSDVGSWYPHQLSGSMKRRLALLRAFLYPSQTLLMDEPFSGLDINIKQKITKLFLELWSKDKRTVIFVSHDLDEILNVADYIYVMSQKPTKILTTIPVKIQHKNRKLYHKKIIAIKKQLINLTKKWD